MPLFFWYDHSLGSRAEICKFFSLVKIFILKSSDLYNNIFEEGKARTDVETECFFQLFWDKIIEFDPFLAENLIYTYKFQVI